MIYYLPRNGGIEFLDDDLGFVDLQVSVFGQSFELLQTVVLSW